MKARLLKFDIRRAGKILAIVFGGLLLVNGIFYVLMTRPRIGEFEKLNSASSPLIQQLKAYEKAVVDKEEFVQAVQQAMSDLETIKKDLLKTRDERMIEVQAEVEKLTNMFQISLEQVQYDTEVLEEEGVERFAMVVPLEGGYQSLRKFLSAVEDSDKFLIVERVALATGAEGGVMLQLQITLATYFELREDRLQASLGRRS